jgi:host factor-I protein
MLPIKDAPRPTPGHADAPSARAADPSRQASPAQGPAAPGSPGSGPSATAGAGQALAPSGSPVASPRPSYAPTGHHQSHGNAHGPSHGTSHGGSGGGPPRREVGREAKSAGSPNIQDVFLNYARREKLTVVIQLLDGQAVEGRIKNFDRFALIVDHGGVDHLVFKHAIATIRSPRSIGSYYASHEAS